MKKAPWLLALSLFLGAAFFHQPMDYDNTKSRYLLLGSLVDRGTLDIDPYEDYTIDKAVLNGHFYSIKPIGLSLLAVPVYAVLRRAGAVGPIVARDPSGLVWDTSAKYFTRLAVVTAPFAVLGALLFLLCVELGASPRGAGWAVLAYGFGTIALNHGTIFSGHETAAFFLFAGFFALRRAVGGRAAVGAAIAGACAGLAVLSDYFCVVYVAALGVYALSLSTPRSTLAWFVAGGLPFAAVLGWYNAACFGSPWSMGYAHFAFEPLRAGSAHGLFGIGLLDPHALWGLVGSVGRGLFFVSPVLLLSAAGVQAMRKRRELFGEAVLSAAIPAAALLMYSGYFGWHGGWTYGPRYFVPVLPFLAVPLAWAAGEEPWFLSLFAVSTAQVACAQIGWPHAAPEIVNPVFEFMLPLMPRGGLALTLLGGGASALGGVLQYGLAAVPAYLALRGLPQQAAPRRTRAWVLGLGAWAAFVVFRLAFARTADQALVHHDRGIVLYDTAAALHSQELFGAAQAELDQGVSTGAR